MLSPLCSLDALFIWAIHSVVGSLKGHDALMNLVLEDAIEYMRGKLRCVKYPNIIENARSRRCHIGDSKDEKTRYVGLQRHYCCDHCA